MRATETEDEAASMSKAENLASKKVGVLALQGDFEAHSAAIARAGATPVLVRKPADLENIAGLVIPGGGSTTMLKLLREEGMFELVAEFGRKRPIFGTCAGALLMARGVTHSDQRRVGLIDTSGERIGCVSVVGERTPVSTGYTTVRILMPETVHTMAEKNIDISDQYPKPLHPELASKSDLIVNMSGEDLPDEIRTPVRNWLVRDPIGETESTYREVRDQIEQLVMDLILEIRRGNKKSDSVPRT